MTAPYRTAVATTKEPSRYAMTTTQPFLMLVVTLTVLVVGGCESAGAKAALPPAASAQPMPVRVVKPATQAGSGESRVTSTLRSRSEATLSAKTTGQIVKLDVRVGDRVKAGQPLVRLDASMASISLQIAKAAERLAQANLANAKTELERATALRDQGALSDANFDKLRMAFDIASAQADQARAAIRASSQQISDASIVAPFAGVVSARFKNPGDTVSGMPPTPLQAVVDPDLLEVRMAVPEALAPLLQAGDLLPAVASPSGTAFQVRVSALGATVDALSRTVEVLADVVEPVDPGLKPGALATVDLTGSRAMKGLFLPASAVHSADGKSFVYVVSNDALQRKTVVGAPIRPGTILVTEGLSPSDAVALDVTGIPEGQPVRALAN
jgi:RND family efflux transporter MFP subunit